MPIFYGLPDGWTFDMVVEQMPDSNFNPITRSTVALLAFWKDTANRIQYINAQLGTNNQADEVKVCFEYPVRPNVLRCKASFTDVMLIYEGAAVAIEGKRTEGRYETVNAWLNNGNRENRMNVLNFWIRQLSPYYCHNIDSNNIINDDIVYQMLHRAASACSLNKKVAHVVYQIFCVGEEEHPNYENDLRELIAAIKPNTERLKFWLHTITTNPTAYYLPLVEAANPMDVRNRLITSDIFEFPECPDHQLFQQVLMQ